MKKPEGDFLKRINFRQKIQYLLHNLQRNSRHQKGEDGAAKDDAVPTKGGKTVVGLGLNDRKRRREEIRN